MKSPTRLDLARLDWLNALARAWHASVQSSLGQPNYKWAGPGHALAQPMRSLKVLVSFQKSTIKNTYLNTTFKFSNKIFFEQNHLDVGNFIYFLKWLKYPLDEGKKPEGSLSLFHSRNATTFSPLLLPSTPRLIPHQCEGKSLVKL